jgi:hypothetical protein
MALISARGPAAAINVEEFALPTPDALTLLMLVESVSSRETRGDGEKIIQVVQFVVLSLVVAHSLSKA